MVFDRTLALVKGSRPPLGFLQLLVTFLRTAPDDIFAPNDIADEIYTRIAPQLATPASDGRHVWDDLRHRKSAIAEAARVHAGFESDWNWREGVDVTNHTSMTHKAGEEAGAFEMSFDMELLDHGYMRPFALAHGLDTPEHFIERIKADPLLDLETYFRLIRVNIAWAGPIVRNEINRYLNRDSMQEFRQLLS